MSFNYSKVAQVVRRASRQEIGRPRLSRRGMIYTIPFHFNLIQIIPFYSNLIQIIPLNYRMRMLVQRLPLLMTTQRKRKKKKRKRYFFCFQNKTFYPNYFFQYHFNCSKEEVNFKKSKPIDARKETRFHNWLYLFESTVQTKFSQHKWKQFSISNLIKLLICIFTYKLLFFLFFFKLLIHLFISHHRKRKKRRRKKKKRNRWLIYWSAMKIA